MRSRRDPGMAEYHRRLRGRSWRSWSFATRTMPLGGREAGLAAVNSATGAGSNGRLGPKWRIPPTGFAISCQIPSHGKHSPSDRPVFAVSGHNLLVAPPIVAGTRTSSSRSLQKMYLRPNCNSRMVRAEVTTPNVLGARMFRPGGFQFG